MEIGKVGAAFLPGSLGSLLLDGLGAPKKRYPSQFARRSCHSIG